MYLHIYIYICTYVYTCTCMRVIYNIYMYVRARLYVCTVNTYIYIYMNIFTYMYTYMYPPAPCGPAGCERAYLSEMPGHSVSDFLLLVIFHPTQFTLDTAQERHLTTFWVGSCIAGPPNLTTQLFDSGIPGHPSLYKGIGRAI